MAVTKQAASTQILIAVETGVSADGSASYSTRTISKVDPAATDEKIYTVASAIGTLQSCPVGDIARRDVSVLVRS